jgi:hypothetical protein
VRFVPPAASSHQRCVEVDVGGWLLGADGGVGELLLLAAPREVGDPLFHSSLNEDDELGRGVPDSAAASGRSCTNSWQSRLRVIGVIDAAHEPARLDAVPPIVTCRVE